MRLRHIEVFHAIMQTGTISGAAQILFISQPAATKILQHCELQLGFALFERVKGRLYPTPEAQKLYAEVDRLNRDLLMVRRLAANLKQQQMENIRLVCTPTLANSIVPAALGQWRVKFPNVRCTLATNHTREIVNNLLLGEADLALSLQDPRHPGITVEPLAQGDMTVIAPIGTWSVTMNAVPLSVTDLPSRLIALPDDDPLGNQVMKACESNDVEVNPLTVVQTYQLARSLVESGGGAAVIDPFTAASIDTSRACSRPLAPVIPVHLYLLTANAAPLSSAARQLVSCIKRVAIGKLATAQADTDRNADMLVAV